MTTKRYQSGENTFFLLNRRLFHGAISLYIGISSIVFMTLLCIRKSLERKLPDALPSGTPRNHSIKTILTMNVAEFNPVELKVFLNHIYEFKKGVRQMVLYTTNRKYEEYARKRLETQKINYVIQTVDQERINLFFGRKECINAIRMIVDRPLNRLTPEEDFILGAMLGYDICGQCKRYCTRKSRMVNA